MAETLVKEIMNEGVITCRENDTLDEVAAILSDAEVSALVVVNEEGIAQGVISQIDLVKHYSQDLSGQKAQDVMVEPIVTISDNAPVREGAAKMAKQKIHRLFILDNDKKPVGVLSMTDVVRDMRHDIYKED